MPLKPKQGGEFTPIAHKELVPRSAAPPEQAQDSNEFGGFGGFGGSFAVLPEVVAREAKILQKQAKMQRWLVSGDPILEAEARQWLTAASLAPPKPHRGTHI